MRSSVGRSRISPSSAGRSISWKQPRGQMPATMQQVIGTKLTRRALAVLFRRLSFLVMISSMSAFICKRVHATQANSGKITTFQGGTLFCRLRVPPFLNLGKDYVVFSDSLSSLQAIENCKVENPLILKILKDHNQLINSGKSITFCWIPSHVGI